ncbi:hypothetical protein CW748_02820 [Alteromonadales bacterium alter-6D02]|nr:hypothetical protein CW748_02820 [Alteromonadales bacterium alter-6D02]
MSISRYNQRLANLLVILFTFISVNAFAHGMSDQEKQMILDGGNLEFISLGVTHMLSGYDHLAFVFGIVLCLSKVREIIQYISVFTLGHSITLVLATLYSIQVNYFFIDAIIALSLCYIAFHNVDGFKRLFNRNSPNMLVMIFALGLIHGLGLSTRLQQLPLDPNALLLNIMSFNLGIELGQVLALVVMLLILNQIRNHQQFSKVNLASNAALAVLGVWLCLGQINDYQQDRKLYAEQHQWQDEISIAILPNSGIEYKLQMSQGASIAYSWQADNGKVYYDLHGEPTGDTSGYFKSFKIATENQSHGSLTTDFDGTHGWYWKNPHPFPIKIALKVRGDYQRID